MPLKYKAAFFDIDGTLFDWGSRRFIPSAIEAIKKAQEQGCKVFVSTARCYASAKEFGVFDLGIKWDGWNTFSGGAAAVGHTYVKKDLMSASDMKKLIETVQSFHGNMEVLGVKTRSMIAKKDEVTKEYYSFFADPVSLIRKYKGGEVLGALLYTKEEHDGLIRGALPNLTLRRFAPYAVEVSANPDRDKSHGIKAILDYLGLKKKDAIAFGDTGADLAMAKAVDLLVITGNGEEEAKSKAEYVSEHIAEDGIKKALIEFGLEW
ncbi:MAG: HAD hydrolase family protein [Bacillota bacterium]|nr:HAD hydrolase family protein [Bacillota bacterium]